MNWIAAFALCLVAIGTGAVSAASLDGAVSAASLDDAISAQRRGDAALALSIYKPLADQGDVQAQNGLGVLYRDGLGTAKNDAESVRWFREAATQGFAPAQANLGYMLETGRGVARDEREAARFYRLAAERRPGPAPSASRFAEGLKAYDAGQPAVALEIWRSLGDQGHAGAQYNVGVMYEKGTGVRQDPAEAARWFFMAAYQGDPDAQYELAAMYESGSGLASDLAQARRWYTNAMVAARASGQATTLERTRARLAALANATQESIDYEGGRFVIVRGADGACVVAIQGLITRETARKFDDVLDRSKAAGCRAPWLLLESPGGMTDGGLQLGREIRARQLRTVTRADCASACGLIFVAGVERVLTGPYARIGLHQPATMRASGEQWCGNTTDSSGVREIRSYLRFMVPEAADRVMREIMDTSCNAITWAQGKHALELGIATKLEWSASDTAASPAKAR